MNNKVYSFISIAEKPGKVGSVVYNNLFKLKNINATYIPLKVPKKNFEKVIKNIKLFSINGCSVSMPYKSKVIKYVDKLDSISKQTNSVNTILNKNNVLYGFNTDYYGLLKSINKIQLKLNNTILIIGSGAMAINTLHILKKKQIKNIYISSRNNFNAKKISKKFYIKFVKWADRNEIYIDTLINCSPIGMDHVKEIFPINKNKILEVKKIIDVVNKPHNTRLIKFCIKNKINHISGKFISVNQLIRQIEIYTNLKIGFKQIEKMLNYK